MNFDSIWFLMGLPAAFALGWLASRLDLRQLRTENRSAPKAYFKGLNHLLNEQQDQAIDAFIEAVQKDPETSELHFALGNLFRRRGEYERAIRVHQHLLARADLSASDHDRAQYALAMDFLKAGLLNLAEESLCKLAQTAHANSAQLILLGIYERSRDWAQAQATAKAIEQTAHAPDFSQRRAHHLCEQALLARQKQHFDDARQLLQQALLLAPQAPRARIELAQLEKQHENFETAWQLLEQAIAHTPASAPLFARDYAELAHALGKAAHAQEQLQALQQRMPSIDLVEALIWLDQQAQNQPQQNQQQNQQQQDLQQEEKGTQRYITHLASTPSLIAAARWLEQEKLLGDPHQAVVGKALQAAIKPLGRYRCAACGFETQQHYWQCPCCQTWDSYPPQRVEEL